MLKVITNLLLFSFIFSLPNNLARGKTKIELWSLERIIKENGGVDATKKDPVVLSHIFQRCAAVYEAMTMFLKTDSRSDRQKLVEPLQKMAKDDIGIFIELQRTLGKYDEAYELKQFEKRLTEYIDMMKQSRETTSSLFSNELVKSDVETCKIMNQ